MTTRTVQPPLSYIPANLKPWLLRVARPFLLLWLRFNLGVYNVRLVNAEELVEQYRLFQSGKTRLMLAFRHPSLDDPPCLAYTLSYALDRAARHQGVSLKHPLFAHFIYDRGIPLWGGSRIEWVLPRLGASSLLRGKLDRQGLQGARDLFANGSMPLAIAPEGTINGHSEKVNPLEPGVAQLAFWCASDLHKAERDEEVAIAPIGIRYLYIEPPWTRLDALLTQLERDCGIAPPVRALSSSDANPVETLYPRLVKLGERTLSMVEAFYVKLYNHEPPENGTFQTRLQALLGAAIAVAESHFNLKPKEDFISRRHRVEQAAWDWIYREDIKDLDALSSFERSLADRAAAEASDRLWHMRLMERFTTVNGTYVRDNPTVERFAETTLLLWYLVALVTEQPTDAPPELGARRAEVVIGNTIAIADYWQDYQSSRRQTVDKLTQDLQASLEAAIAPRDADLDR
ncbi:MAG: 1-acyl-sn-glycerol-3-phosphate acyltransferase [Cyanobacteria bacterium J06639_1]